MKEMKGRIVFSTLLTIGILTALSAFNLTEILAGVVLGIFLWVPVARKAMWLGEREEYQRKYMAKNIRRVYGWLWKGLDEDDWKLDPERWSGDVIEDLGDREWHLVNDAVRPLKDQTVALRDYIRYLKKHLPEDQHDSVERVLKAIRS